MPLIQNPFAGIESPFFWPAGLALSMDPGVLEAPEKSRAFFESVVKKDAARFSPPWATSNKIIYDKPAFVLRDFSASYAANEVPTLIVPPYDGHGSTLVDFNRKQSIVETFLQNSLTRVFCIEWRDAVQKTKDYDIDDCLTAIHTVVNDLGGRVNLVGLGLGGWMTCLYAARYPPHVAALVCAGAPLDAEAKNSGVLDLAKALPMSFYENLVAAGDGVLEGRFMLKGLQVMNAERHMMNKYLSIYEYIDDPEYKLRDEAFERWYLNMVDFPGRLYVQIIERLFKENRFAKGEMTVHGQTIGPQTVACPSYLLAGAFDDSVPKEQVFGGAALFGTPPSKLFKDLASCGHMGLFMGTKALRENWSKIAVWLLTQNI